MALVNPTPLVLPPGLLPEGSPRFRVIPGGKSPVTVAPKTGVGWVGLFLNAVAVAQAVQVVGADWKEKWHRLNEGIEAHRRPVTPCAAHSEWAEARRKLKSDAERETLERKISELEDLIRRSNNNGDTLRLPFLQSELTFLQFKLRALGATSPADSRDPHVAIRNMASTDSTSPPSSSGASDPESAVPQHPKVSLERWRIVDDGFKTLLRANPWLKGVDARVEWRFDLKQLRFEPDLKLRKSFHVIAENDPQRDLRSIHHILDRTNAVLDQLAFQGGERLRLVVPSGDVVNLVQWSVELERHLIEGLYGQDPVGLNRTDVATMADVMRIAGRLLRYERHASFDDAYDDLLPFLILDAAARRYRGLLVAADEHTHERRDLSQKLQVTQDLLEGSSKVVWDYSKFMNRTFDFTGYAFQPWLKDWRRVSENEESLGRRLNSTAERFRESAGLGLYHVALLGQCLMGLFAKALLQEDKAEEIFRTAIYYHDRARLLGLLTEADQLLAVEGELFFTNLMRDAGIPRHEVGNVPRELARTWLPWTGLFTE